MFKQESDKNRNRIMYVFYDFNCLIKIVGLLKVTEKVIMYQKQCKLETLLLQTTVIYSDIWPIEQRHFR